jgi:outer membrane protein assembly factor BamB
MWRTIQVCSLAAGLLISLPVRAEHTRFWRQSDYGDFEKGNAKGVALRSDGKLMPAPSFAQFADPNLAYLWALRVDSKGRLYAAGGSNAKVLRFDAAGKPITVFESQELEAQALALDAHDNLYVGTSPDGKVYKVTPEGKSSVFFEPKSKYIWALAIDSSGTLFVGTGDKGEVFSVSPDGKGQVFYKSDENHARSLAFDSNGNLIIGTDPNGLIIRVETKSKQGAALPEAGTAFVLYETSKKEVTALASDRSDNIYAAAIGEKQRMTPFISPGAIAPQIQGQAVTIQNQSIVVTPQGQGQPAPPLVIQPFQTMAGGGEVYQISADGSPLVLWNSREDLVYSLGFSSTGKLLLGTGNRGVLIQLEGDEVFSNLAKTASAQVTGMAAGPGGAIYLATANPGKIFTLGPGYEAEGSFESQTFDAKMFSHWGRLNWWGQNGATGGKVEFYVRSGNTSSPEKNWSRWAGPYTKPGAETAGCPAARFVQWKAVFRTSTGEKPDISWVSVAYLPKNVAPEIDGIVMQDPGVRAQSFPGQPQGPGQVQPVPLRMPQQTNPVNAAIVAAAAAAQEYQQKHKLESPAQGFAQKGYQTAVWAAHDENDDDLIFTIYFRSEGEKNWLLLKDKIEQRFYSWDTSSMPDGAYALKIAASDAPSNPPDDALTAERQSDRFEVDNTPPTVQNLRAENTAAGVRVRFEAQDSSSVLDQAEFSLDAGAWTQLFPVGQLTDSRQESYEIVLRNLSPGEHTIAVQVSDRFDNSTTAKVTFTVPPPSH